jgi:alpha-1,2-mannosyltransferase
VLILVAGVGPVLWHYLQDWPQDQWQVDLQVYREAGRSILYGRPIYDELTDAPQLLPFTYPPFAALLATPIALISSGAVAWLWSAGQVAATAGSVWIAGRPLLSRAGRWAPVATAGLTVPIMWLQPLSDGIRFGQVDVFIVLVCLIDLTAVRPRWTRGALIGLATAVKLTPGTFLLYFAFARRWRPALGLVAAAVAATVAAFLALPEASLAFWGGAISDPTRLGQNSGTSNQSIHGVLLRVGPSGAAGTALWALLAVVGAWCGFRIARLAQQRGQLAMEVGAVGLVAVLISPVSWIHHLAWLCVVIPALLGDGRDRVRLGYAALLTGWFLCRLPWWGITWSVDHPGSRWFGHLLQNADLLGAVLALLLLWLALRRPSSALPESEAEVDAGGLQLGEDTEDEAQPATDPTDRRQPHPA